MLMTFSLDDQFTGRVEFTLCFPEGLHARSAADQIQMISSHRLSKRSAASETLPSEKLRYDAFYLGIYDAPAVDIVNMVEDANRLLLEESDYVS